MSTCACRVCQTHRTCPFFTVHGAVRLPLFRSNWTRSLWKGKHWRREFAPCVKISTLKLSVRETLRCRSVSLYANRQDASSSEQDRFLNARYLGRHSEFARFVTREFHLRLHRACGLLIHGSKPQESIGETLSCPLLHEVDPNDVSSEPNCQSRTIQARLCC